MTASTPSGTFTSKTSRHPASAPEAAMIRPPTSGPTATETPIVAPTLIAKARARVRSANISWMNAVIGVKNIPPASP